jgi:hypothetical protein
MFTFLIALYVHNFTVSKHLSKMGSFFVLIVKRLKEWTAHSSSVCRCMLSNANRRRSILAQQKVKELGTPKPLPDNFQLPKLTAEERKAIFAPRPAANAPKHLQGNEWVRAWLSVSKATIGLTAFTAIIFGGVIAKESKKGIKH